MLKHYTDLIINAFTLFCIFRFPVRDDLIVSVDVKGKQPQPLPDAQASLSIHSDFMDDAIKVWDFLNNFR